MREDPRDTSSGRPTTRASMRSDTSRNHTARAEARTRQHVDWRTGDVGTLGAPLSAICAVFLGAGGGLIASVTVAGAATPLASTILLWSIMLGAVVYSISVLRPRGLLRFKLSDLVFGVASATLIRIFGGLIAGADLAPFPTLQTSASPASWAVTQGIPAMLIGPAVEEFFFRAVLLVAAYLLLRDRIGWLMAGVIASTASAGGFVLLHGAFAPLVASDSIQLLMVGLACSLLVLLTGRLWGALVLHIFYNMAFLLTAVLGTVLS